MKNSGSLFVIYFATFSKIILSFECLINFIKTQTPEMSTINLSIKLIKF